MDADDWLELDMYECLYQIAVQTKSDLIQANYFEHLDGNVKLAFDNEEQGFHELDTIEAKNAFFENHHLQSIWAGIYKTKLFSNREIRFRHYVKYEDNYFSGIVQYAINSYYLVKKAFYHYRIHDTSNSHNRNDENHFIRLEVELEKLKYYQMHGIFNLYYKNIRKTFLENFNVNTIHIMFCKFDCMI